MIAHIVAHQTPGRLPVPFPSPPNGALSPGSCRLLERVFRPRTRRPNRTPWKECDRRATDVSRSAATGLANGNHHSTSNSFVQ